jgi:hypothetical protein
MLEKWLGNVWFMQFAEHFCIPITPLCGILNPVGIFPTGTKLTFFKEKTMSFAEAMCVFIADCMCVVSMGLDKAAAIIEMAVRANVAFKGFTSTPATVAEVKAVILSFA